MNETTDPLVDLNAQVMDRLAAGVAVMTLVDRDGKVAWTKLGALERDALVAEIEDLL